MKRVLVFLLSFVMLFGFMACGDPTDSADTDSKATDIDGYFTLYGFETDKRDFNEVRIRNGYFGDISYNFDLQYVKSGSSSIKMRPLGSVNTLTRPYAYFPLQSTYLGFDYGNIEQVTEIAFEIYNVQSENKNCYVGMVFTGKENYVQEVETFSLSSGWNTVKYKVNREILSIGYDLTKCYAVAVGFDRCENLELETLIDVAPIFYMDNFKIKTTTDVFNFENPIYLDEYEVCDFEKAYQQFAFYANGSGLRDFGVVKASDYGIDAASGSNVLRVELAAVDNTETSGLTLIEPMKELINFKQYEGSEEDYVFCMDVYQNCDLQLMFEFYFGYLGYLDWAGVITKPYQWVTARIPFTSIKNFLNYPRLFRVFFVNKNVEGAEYFIDNLRIEKVR